MTAEDLVAVEASQWSPGAACPWAKGSTFMLPRSLLQAPQERRPGAADELRLLHAFTDAAPMSARLPFSYRLLPPFARSLAARVIGRLQRGRAARWARFPRWPLDLSADFLSDALGGPSSPFARRTPVLLTHDLDSPEGLENLVAKFLPEEERVGARSTSFVVPCAWPLDRGLLDETARRGHGLGIHGYDHSNRTPFLSPQERLQRLEGAMPLARAYGMTGYRAPSLVRTRALLRDLARHFRYDSSIPTSGGLFPVPNNGCASARPFLLDGIVEIPVSLPRDGSLLFLGYDPSRILSLWIECAEAISRSGGVVVLLAHCEERFSGSKGMLDAYRRFLDHIAASERFEWSTPERILAATQGGAGSGAPS